VDQVDVHFLRFEISPAARQVEKLERRPGVDADAKRLPGPAQAPRERHEQEQRARRQEECGPSLAQPPVHPHVPLEPPAEEPAKTPSAGRQGFALHRVKVRLLRGGVKAGETRKMSVDGTFFRKYPASAGPGGRPAVFSRYTGE